jgi:2-oxoglutarate dehydrogenase complex dehydrogenase (E1) component-like enzyme
VYPTTAAQYFHVLRRQAVSARHVPLVCFTPKRYLRMPSTRSPLAAFTDGGFSAVLDDRAAPEVVNRVILCTGKIAHELMDERDARGARAAVVRIEELYPWPEAELFSILDRYPDATQVWWVQEEPANMGAWNYIHIRLHRVLRDRAKLKHVARAPSASPASGSTKVHDAEQRRLLAAAFAKL